MSYLTQTLRGMGWMGSLRGVTRLAAYLRIAVLARILSPSQFGVYGIATLVLAFLEIVTETGINVFLIQARDKITTYKDTAWILSILRGFVISAIIFLAAPFVSIFFKNQESLGLLKLISLVPLVRGFINPLIINFQKELEFRKEFFFRGSIFLFDALVAIIVALLTRSASSLVWGMFAGALLEVFLSFILVKPSPKFAFDFEKAKRIINKGKWVTGALVFQYLFRQGDDIVVGRILGTGSLGLYQAAYKISTLPVTEIADTAAKVTFPLYSKITKEKEVLKENFLRTSFGVVVLAFLFGGIIFIQAELVIRIILGNKWLEATSVLKVLVIFGVLRAFSNVSNSLFYAQGREDYVTKVEFLSTLILLVSIFPLVNLYGLSGAALAPILGTLASLPFVFNYIRRIL